MKSTGGGDDLQILYTAFPDVVPMLINLIYSESGCDLDETMRRLALAGKNIDERMTILSDLKDEFPSLKLSDIVCVLIWNNYDIDKARKELDKKHGDH